MQWQGQVPPGYNNQFRVFDKKYNCGQKVRIFFAWLGLTCLGGFLRHFPIVGAFWPVCHILSVYVLFDSSSTPHLISR